MYCPHRQTQSWVKRSSKLACQRRSACLQLHGSGVSTLYQELSVQEADEVWKRLGRLWNDGSEFWHGFIQVLAIGFVLVAQRRRILEHLLAVTHGRQLLEFLHNWFTWPHLAIDALAQSLNTFCKPTGRRRCRLQIKEALRDLGCLLEDVPEGQQQNPKAAR